MEVGHAAILFALFFLFGPYLAKYFYLTLNRFRADPTGWIMYAATAIAAVVVAVIVVRALARFVYKIYMNIKGRKLENVVDDDRGRRYLRQSNDDDVVQEQEQVAEDDGPASENEKDEKEEPAVGDSDDEKFNINISKDYLVPRWKDGSLKSLSEFWEWEGDSELSSTKSAASPVIANKNSTKPMFLVCHDFSGGYKEDCYEYGYVQPATSPRECSITAAYRIANWNVVDVFVYFSHDFVTIPPKSWIRASRVHGAKVLGTFITEWERGKEMCEEIFASNESSTLAAKKLKGIAEHYGFDGWLINIENPIDPLKIPNVLVFLQTLKESGIYVIWYDSVTKEGKLKWQNQLNDMNAEFFNASNGIFTNYTWKKEYPMNSSNFCSNRCSDIFIGIDCYGRNTYGGGGMTCNVAQEVINEARCSTALFAPGWTLDSATQGSTESRVEAYPQLDSLFWKKISDEIPLDRRAMRELKLPFFSDFCDGGSFYGYYVNGFCVSRGQWLNMSRTTFQPSNDILDQCVVKNGIVARVSRNVAFSGGCSLCFENVRNASGIVANSESAFAAHDRISIPIGGGPSSHLFVEIVAKSDKGDGVENMKSFAVEIEFDEEFRLPSKGNSDEARFTRSIRFIPGQQHPKQDGDVILPGSRLSSMKMRSGMVSGCLYLTPVAQMHFNNDYGVPMTTDLRLHELGQSQSSFSRSSDTENGWIRSTFQIPIGAFRGRVIKFIRVVCTRNSSMQFPRSYLGSVFIDVRESRSEVYAQEQLLRGTGILDAAVDEAKLIAGFDSNEKMVNYISGKILWSAGRDQPVERVHVYLRTSGKERTRASQWRYIGDSFPNNEKCDCGEFGVETFHRITGASAVFLLQPVLKPNHEVVGVDESTTIEMAPN